MLFNTLPFAGFFAAVFLLWTVFSRASQVRFWLLIAASLVFYSFWDWRYLLLLGGVAFGDWALALVMERTERPAARRALMVLTTVLNLGVLGAWKYTDFALDTLRPVAESLHWSWPEPLRWVLPVGISFFTFQGLGYVVDVYRREKPSVRSFPQLFLALAFFPHLVAGPIVRPWELIPRLVSPKVLDDERFGRAVLCFLRGMVKKAAADYLAMNLVDRVFDLPPHYSTLEVLAAIYGYALQIYGDFSGYTDMAIGVAALLGIDLPRNFDHPYSATSLKEFWRRWHISLSTWLRDYLYISLGGSRTGFWRTQLNLFLTMLLGGLWHGASWNFVIWGAIHGVVQVLGKLWESFGPKALKREGPVGAVLGWFITFHTVAIAWVFFRAETFSGALELLAQVWHGWGGGYANLKPELVAVLVAGFALHLVPQVLRERAEGFVIRAPALAQAGAAMACLYVVQLLTGGSTQPFIYFQF